MILIRFKGEQLLVESTKGYPRAKVIDRDVPHPPSDHCHWEGGAWIEDADAKAGADRRAKLAAMTRDELVDHIVTLNDQRVATRVSRLTTAGSKV